MNAAMPPAAWALATAWSATVVLCDNTPLARKLWLCGSTTSNVGCSPASSTETTSSYVYEATDSALRWSRMAQPDELSLSRRVPAHRTILVSLVREHAMSMS